MLFERPDEVDDREEYAETHFDAFSLEVRHGAPSVRS